MRGKRKIRRGRKEKKRRGRRGEINKKRKKEEKEEEKKKERNRGERRNFNTRGGTDTPSPRDNFDMRGGRYIYPLSTVITYTTAAPPSALSLDQNSRGHPNPREKTMLVSYPLPPRPYPTN